jgi:hypothetical protein
VLKGEPAPEGFTANMNYCLLMEETGMKKGRFCPRWRKHLDGNTIRTPAAYVTTCLKYCTLAGEFNSCSAPPECNDPPPATFMSANVV